MKKITVTLGLLASMISSATWGQSQTANYQEQKLKVDEINLISSYYGQTGNNSAVTGGIGTEKLMNLGNSFDLKLSVKDKKNRIHNITADFNADYYTSASSDNIDPRTVSSASSSDIHVYPSLAWSIKNDKTGITKGVSYSYSTEYDYKSNGVGLNFSKLSKDKNREVSVKAGAFFDTWTVILPYELRPAGYGSGSHGDRYPIDYKPRNSYNASVAVSQVIDKRLQVLFIIEPSFQEGLLSTPFHRIYFTNGSETVEKLPNKRVKLAIGSRLSYFMGDRTILRGFYRYYTDDWGMVAHTMNIEAVYKFTPFVSLSPFYRFNSQSAVSYFGAYGQHDITKLYHTSDYDISNFDSHFIGTGFRVAPPDGVLGIKNWNAFEIRIGHYIRSTGLLANSVTVQMKIK